MQSLMQPATHFTDEELRLRETTEQTQGPKIHDSPGVSAQRVSDCEPNHLFIF